MVRTCSSYVHRSLLATIAAAFIASPLALAQNAALVYPKAKTVDQIDDYHGTKVPDPYRWLEDDARTSSEVKQWVDAENLITFGYLKAIP